MTCVQPRGRRKSWRLRTQVSRGAGLQPCALILPKQTPFAHTVGWARRPVWRIICAFNDGTGTARLILTFTSAGLEKFFEETLELATDRHAPPPQNVEAVVARYVAAAPKYGLEFLPLPGGVAAAELV